ncbi:MAG: Gfo/Idh/MocA family protein [Kiloniellaceae bacterium]
MEFPKPGRRLRLGVVGGGRGAFIGEVHAAGARLTNRWEIVAGALSSEPRVAERSAADWLIPAERAYSDYRDMAEREAARPDGVDAVAIATPNHLHHDVARAFIDAGIDVICDKPLTTNLDDALDLVRRTRRAGVVFGLTHAFAAYPMVRQAKQMVAEGRLGAVRQVHVEYVQDWLAEDSGRSSKQAAWRLDPTRAGPAGTTADIGTHAWHLATFVTGLAMTRLRAELHVCGPAKSLDDTAYMTVRYNDEIPGTLWVTQVAPGNDCALRLRVYGERAGLEWHQESPEVLRFSKSGEPPQVMTRGAGAGILPGTNRYVRTPRGHPEGWLEAWANLYTELAVAIEARRDGREVDRSLLNYPTVEDGARGVKFIEAALESSAAGGTWVDCALQIDDALPR